MVDLHVDTGNQIDNSWNKDTVIGIYADDKSVFHSIKIPHSLKLNIKGKLKDYQENILVCYLQVYLLYLCFIDKEEFFSKKSINKCRLCPDIRPIKKYIPTLEKCFAYHGKQDYFEMLKFKIKEPKEKSKAHSSVSKVIKGKKKENRTFQKNDVDKFIKFFIRQSIKKKG